MQYIPQSHHWGECQPANFFKDDGYFKGSDHPELPTHSNSSQIIDVVLEAGRGVAHHPLLAHKSHSNASDRERRGWSLTWVDASITWDPDHAPHPYTVFHNVKKVLDLEATTFEVWAMKILFVELEMDRDWSVASIGPAYLASFVRPMGFHVDILHLQVDVSCTDGIEQILNYDPDVLAMSLTTRQWLRAKEILNTIRQTKPSPQF